jgi:hypothetical protein
MAGVFAYLSYLSVYYLVLVVVDVIGSVREYKKTLLSSEVPQNISFKIDFNSDLAVAALIYLVSYYSGVFDG